MRIQHNLSCPSRDGVKLATDVYLPDADGAYPVVLLRTPYGKEHLPTEPLYDFFPRLVADGYGVAAQDLRGTGQSGGEIGLNGQCEHADGHDAVEWLAAQPFCDGSVGMFGLSFFGFTQTAAASGGSPHLKAICPFMAPSQTPFGASQRHTIHMRHLSWAYHQLLSHAEHYLPDPEFRAKTLPILTEYGAKLDEICLELPLNKNRAAALPGVPMLRDYLDLVEGVEDPAYWAKMNAPLDFSRVHTAIFYGTGWLDGAREWTIDSYLATRRSGDKWTRDNARLLIGPWTHGGHLPSQVEDIDFGRENSGANQRVADMMHRWFDRHIKGKDTDAFEGRVRYFVLGANAWERSDDWPPPEAVMRPFYLAADGRLSAQAPAEAGEARYAADPMHPTPSEFRDRHGRSMIPDWAEVSEREDVLVFRTGPLERSLTIAGGVRLKLYAATDAPDTDFACRLLDIAPDGRETQLLAGLVRAAYRKGFFQKEPIVPGDVTEYAFTVGNVANRFLPGHRVGVQICSYMYPAHNRNLNTAEPSTRGTAWAVAHQRVLYGGAFASRVEIPVLEREE